jgi:hypothetical protein
MREIVIKSNLNKIVSSGIAPTQSSTDDFKNKLMKLIPAEITGAYLAIKNFMDSSTKINIEGKPGWIIVGGLLILLYFYYGRLSGVKSVKQLAFMSIAFLVWVFSIGGPFNMLMPDEEIRGIISGVVLIFCTLSIPIFFKE